MMIEPLPENFSKRKRRTTYSISEPPKKNSCYKRVYLFLKAQQTVLGTIQSMLLKYITECPDEANAIIPQLNEWINSILNSKLKDRIRLSSEIMVIIREKIEDQNIPYALEKIETMILTLCLSYMRLSSLFGSDNNVKHTHCTNNHSQASNSSLLTHDNGETPLVVCRICDEYVPIDLFEQHSESCLAGYRAEEHKTETNKKIKEMMEQIENRYLDVGPSHNKEEMISQCLPMLHLYFLLEGAYNINEDSNDSISILEEIENSIWEIPDNDEFIDIIGRAFYLIKEKEKNSYIFAQVSKVLQQTRVSGNATRSAITQASIEDFHFIKRVSSGAYSRVFLAKKVKTGDIYAIKVTRRKDIKQKNQMARILTEKDILLQFSNPYIAKFFYSITGKENLYIVMEYLPGGDLYSLLQNFGSIDEESTKTYALQIIAALRYLHENGIIHRDLKPDNILIAEDGKLKLTDFGLSHLGIYNRQSAHDPSLSVASSLVGTPDYMAPEIVMNMQHSFAADYWSLGVIIYELLAGEPPFHGETEMETHTNILKGKVDFTGMNITEEAKDFIKKLLKTDPEKRLGAKNFADVIMHPWIKGINAEDQESPFIPYLRSDEDTGYFEQRYSFDESDDSDIIIDMHDKCVDYDLDIKSFSSVDVEQLGKSNEELVKKYKGITTTNQSEKRSRTFSAPLNNSLLVENPQTKLRRIKKKYERKKLHTSSKSNSDDEF